MKKILIIAVIAAAGIGAYLFNEQQNCSASYNVLDYIPADTVPKNQIKPDHGRVTNSLPRSVATVRGYTLV